MVAEWQSEDALMTNDERIDDELLTETGRQCSDVVAVRDEPRPDGFPFVCDACLTRTLHRAVRDPLSVHLFDTAILMARLR